MIEPLVISTLPLHFQCVGVRSKGPKSCHLEFPAAYSFYHYLLYLDVVCVNQLEGEGGHVDVYHFIHGFKLSI